MTSTAVQPPRQSAAPDTPGTNPPGGNLDPLNLLDRHDSRDSQDSTICPPKNLLHLPQPLNDSFSSSSSSSSSMCSTPGASAPASPEVTAAVATPTATPVVSATSGGTSFAGCGGLPRLVIFDKDGTLICFHSMWLPWLQTFIKRLEAASGLVLADDLNSLYGFNVERQKFEVGLLAEGTMDQCRDGAIEKITEMIGRERAEELVRSCWSDCDTSSSQTLRFTCDALPVLRALKARGVKLAMCTADSRQGALGAVDKLGVASFFDMIVAGGDEDSRPKPDPHNALKICRSLGVAPAETVMIGDTRADAQFGKNAGLGLVLGVLSGVGGGEDLRQADDIIENVEQLFTLFPVLKS